MLGSKELLEDSWGYMSQIKARTNGIASFSCKIQAIGTVCIKKQLYYPIQGVHQSAELCYQLVRRCSLNVLPKILNNLSGACTFLKGRKEMVFSGMSWRRRRSFAELCTSEGATIDLKGYMHFPKKDVLQ